MVDNTNNADSGGLRPMEEGFGAGGSDEDSSSRKKHHPMGFFLRSLVPRSLKKKDRGFASESTPLNQHQADATGTTYAASSGEQNDPLLPNNDATSKRSSWQSLRDSVSQGEFLLQSALSGSKMTQDETERMREEAQATISQSMDFSLTQCIIAILCYMAIAVLAFSFVFDHWSFVDSMYFSVVTFTTIGYGDLAPDTYAGRIFTCFFAISGVACLGIAIGEVGNQLIEAQQNALEQTSELSKYRVLTVFGSDDSTATNSERSQEEKEVEQKRREAEEKQREDQERQQGQCSKLLWEFGFILAILMLFSLLVARDPGIGLKWNLGDALYYTLITASTVGYGDFAPTTQEGRLVAIFFIPLAVGCMGHFLSFVANWIIDSKQRQFRESLATKELTLRDLEIMDTDGDGNVTRAEFLEFMLVAMDKVDKDFIDELRASFNRLDKDNNGTLSRDDLIDSARRKLQSTQRKLELSSYKSKLLQQAEAARDGGPGHRRGSSFWGTNLLGGSAEEEERRGIL